jgi:hypothetical protein
MEMISNYSFLDTTTTVFRLFLSDLYIETHFPPFTPLPELSTMTTPIDMTQPGAFAQAFKW